MGMVNDGEDGARKCSSTTIEWQPCDVNVFLKSGSLEAFILPWRQKQSRVQRCRRLPHCASCAARRKEGKCLTASSGSIPSWNPWQCRRWWQPWESRGQHWYWFCLRRKGRIAVQLACWVEGQKRLLGRGRGRKIGTSSSWCDVYIYCVIVLLESKVVTVHWWMVMLLFNGYANRRSNDVTIHHQPPSIDRAINWVRSRLWFARSATQLE